MKITHIDLFSGIGGAALAADRVWGKGNVQHLFCDNDTFCQKVLEQHWPGAPIFGDIRTLTANAARGRLEGKQVPVRPGRSHEAAADPLGSVDLLTGGFPCQPFSHAGRRKGTDDDRYLWPEMFRTIREFRPRWIVGENVAGLLTIEQGMVLKQIIVDLEGEGYEVECFVIPAIALDAPHRRDRVWIIANRPSDGLERQGESATTQKGYEARSGEAGIMARRSEGSHRDASHSSSIRRGQGRSNSGRSRKGTSEAKERNGSAGSTSIPGNPKNARSIGSGGRSDAYPGRSGREVQDARSDWSRDWPTVAAELCRMDDGLPAELDGFALTKSQHRIHRIKGLGNAWVPRVAEEIFAAIKHIDRT